MAINAQTKISCTDSVPNCWLWEQHEKEQSAEWRKNKLVLDKVWLEPIRADWREVLKKETSLDGFLKWLKKRIIINDILKAKQHRQT